MSETREIILETKGLTKHYGGVQALNDADFKMYADEHIAIVGDNGAGKSTFVRNITGVEQRLAMLFLMANQLILQHRVRHAQRVLRPFTKTLHWPTILMCRLISF